ncbi:hypothetical protein P7K49_008929 [Saguinus oedipus]|uniref:Uncharacterized protein n=1 Tax=Saguinus oedipus TaxID=9490 RepID=A0ABQ9VZ32_SAGOE|nr:hypothetical protein P7K49_008929 [Saguinus oedipus]
MSELIKVEELNISNASYKSETLKSNLQGKADFSTLSGGVPKGNATNWSQQQSRVLGEETADVKEWENEEGNEEKEWENEEGNEEKGLSDTRGRHWSTLQKMSEEAESWFWSSGDKRRRVDCV